MVSLQLLLLFHFLIPLYSTKYFSFDFTISNRTINNTYSNDNENTICNTNLVVKSLLQLYFESKEDICIGTPYQCFKLHFNPSTIYSWVIDAGVRQIPTQNKFNHSLSSSYKLFYEARFTLPSDHLSEGMQFTDQIQIGLFKTNKTVFFLGTEMAKELITPVIGLQIGLKYSSSPSFLENLYNDKEVNSKEFTFEYISPSEGKITFGSNNSLHESLKTNSGHCIEIQLETKFYLPYVVSKSNRITLGKAEVLVLGTVNRDYHYQEAIGFDESFGFIRFPIRYDDIIIPAIFASVANEYKDYCRRMKFNQETARGYNGYEYYVCNKKLINKKLGYIPEIKFYFGNETLILHKEDLFYEVNEEKVILMIVFIEYTKYGTSILIGEPILKHYTILHQYTEDNRGRLLLYSKESNVKRVILQLYITLIVLSVMGSIYNVLMIKCSLPSFKV